MSDEIFDMSELMTLEKILALVGGILVLVSVFLNYWVLESNVEGLEDDSWSGMDEDMRDDIKISPIVTLVFGLICVVFAVLNRDFEVLKGFAPIILLVLGVIALIVVAIDLLDVKKDVDDANDDYETYDLDAELKIGIGLYIGLVGSLLVIVGGALCFFKKET